MNDSAVSVVNVTKKFGNVDAVSNLSFQAPQSGITVLLGPNGAGKTTALRLITGAFQPSEGQVFTLGNKMNDAVAAGSSRKMIGVVTAKPSLYDRLTGWDNLMFAANIYGVDPSVSQNAIWSAAKRFEIHHVLDKKVGGYSTGMKTRLTLARSILHSPMLLLFDEPTSGLDPESAYKVLDLIREMTADNKTVIMCTHLLPEAENLADHIVIMQNGTAVASGSKNTLAKQYLPENIAEITFADSSPSKEDLKKIVENIPEVLEIKQEDKVFKFFLNDISSTSTCVRYLCQKGWSPHVVNPLEPTLERLYFATQRLTGSPSKSFRKENELP